MRGASVGDFPLRKAVITAAGCGTRHYPATNAVQKELFPLVDRDGITKPTLQIVIEEAVAAGIQEIAVIVQPGEERQFKAHFRGMTDDERLRFVGKPGAVEQERRLKEIVRTLTFLPQTEQKGFGHAVFCAREWAAGEPVLLLLGDHVYLSHEERSCVRQVVDAFNRFGRSVLALHRITPDELYLYGVEPLGLGHRLVAAHGGDLRLGDQGVADDIPCDGRRDGVAAGAPTSAGFYELERLLEKPSIEQARRELRTPGLPEDAFLAVFGIYALTATLFDILEEHVLADRRERGEIQLTPALHELIARQGIIGFEAAGEKLDMGTPLGYLQTQAALALAGVHAKSFREFLQRRSAL